MFRDFPTFSRTWASFFWLILFSDLLSSTPSLWLFPSLLFICPYCRKFDFLTSFDKYGGIYFNTIIFFGKPPMYFFGGLIHHVDHFLFILLHLSTVAVNVKAIKVGSVHATHVQQIHSPGEDQKGHHCWLGGKWSMEIQDNQECLKRETKATSHTISHSIFLFLLWLGYPPIEDLKPPGSYALFSLQSPDHCREPTGTLVPWTAAISTIHFWVEKCTWRLNPNFRCLWSPHICWWTA